LKFVTPQYVQNEANPGSPKLEKKASVGSVGSSFSKPLSHQRGSTIINNYYINNNIQLSGFPNFFPQPLTTSQQQAATLKANSAAPKELEKTNK
jgi:hypothetical protein